MKNNLFVVNILEDNGVFLVALALYETMGKRKKVLLLLRLMMIPMKNYRIEVSFFKIICKAYEIIVATVIN